MFRFLADQNVRQQIVDGLLAICDQASVEVVCARHVGLDETEDPELLQWCAESGRILITEDRRTIPPFATDRISAGETVAGVIVISSRASIGNVVEFLRLVVECSEPSEYENQIIWYP